ncbi:MAG: PAS domain S-box protein [Vicinamibacterales bacterium]
MDISRFSSQLGAYFLPDTQHDLRERFYEGLCLVAVVLVFAIILPTNVVQHLPAQLNVALAVFGAVSAILWGLARRERYYPGVFLALQLVVLAVGWYPNAGSVGSLPYYFFVPLSYAVLLFSGRQAWLLSTVIIGEALALMALELRFPAMLVPFSSPHDRWLDLAIGMIVAGLSCVLILWLAVTGYRRERERLRVAIEALTRSEDRFANLFDLNPDAVFLFDLETRRFRDVNAGFTRLTGWSREEASGRTAVDLRLWANPERRDLLFRMTQDTRTVHGFRARFRKRNGEEFWGEISLTIIEGEGTPLALATTRDVTEQVQVEQVIAESRAQLVTLINSTDDLIWLVEPEQFGLTLFNKAFADSVQHGLGLATRAGLRPADLMPGPTADEWCGFYRRALTDGAFTIEYRVPDSDTFLLHSFSPVRIEGRTTGVAVFGKDISAQRRNQSEREHMELQLAEAQKMESLGRLAGGVAHDFNNMLGGIMGYAELLLDDESDPQRRQDLESIMQAAVRSAELTRKLLAFGRRGKNIVEAVDLNAIVQDSVSMLRPSFRPDVVVSIEPESMWTVDADPGQMNQLVVNLCINANEAMPDGGWLRLTVTDVTLDAEHAGALAPGDYVQLAVTDTGVGMPDDVRSRIFEPFFTTKVRGSSPGTGLGLSTVYGIVHLHHGAIDVESTPGHGSRFVVRLPKGTLAPGRQAPVPAAGRGRGLILVVEDEPLLRRLASAALEKLGYDSLTAADGEEGVAVFGARHRDLAGVMLDLKMPKKDGREAFLEFQAIDAAVPVLICSGYGDNEEAQGLISLGARGLLPKPYRVAELAEQLGRLRPR